MPLYSIPSTIEIKNVSQETLSVEKRSFKKELEDRDKVLKKALLKYKDIYPPNHRTLVIVDKNYKDRVLLGDSGVVLERPRNYDNLNNRITQPIQGFVVNDSELPSGAEILCHHNSFQDTNKLFTFENDFEEQGFGLYSIPKLETFVYRFDSKEWKPCNGFILGLRVFKPYKGVLIGVEPKELKNYLYVTSDCALKSKVIKTVHAALYPIVFNDENYNEQTIIRVRHFPNEQDHPREEVICVMNDMTKQVKKGELLVGIDKTNCK
jgi:hypothetical protein